MATFNHISGQEPSTVTFKAATVTQTRNSSLMHQELISLADPESSLSIARVSSLAPASSDAGLIVRQVGFSTIVSVAAMPANSSQVEIRSITGPVSTAAPATSDTGVIVRVVGYSTIVSVASMPAGSTAVSITGPVSTAAPATSDTGVVVRQVGYSTIVQVNGNISSNSSIYLPVRLTNGTAFLAAATDYTDGSTYTTISGPTLTFDNGSNATYRAITITRGLPVNVVGGAVAGPVSTAAPVTTDTGLIVRQVGYSTIVSVASMPANSSQIEVRAMPANSSVVQISAFSAGVISSAAVAANSSALNVRVVGGASSGADFPVSPNSTAFVKNAGFSVDSSNYLNVNASFTGSTDVSLSKFPAGMLSSAAAAANSSALNVRLVGGPSSAADVAINVSSLAGVVTLAANSSQVEVRTLPTNSSIVAVGSIAAGLLSSAAPAGNSSALLVRVVGGPSSAADMAINVSSLAGVVTLAANSSLVSVSAFPSAMVSSGGPAHGSSALLIREVTSSLQSTTFTLLSSASSALYTFLSSAAGRTRVYSYFVGASTNANHSTLLIGDSTTPSKWAVLVSSGVFGANLAVQPPGFLFEAAAGNPLQCRMESASSGIALRVSVSYFID